jgi:hypothetical protein
MLSLNINAALITDVDLELQLLADTSGSVDSTEYNLQLTGYINAFRSASVISAIESGVIGSIAVQYIEWSDSAEQSILVDWTYISNAVEANAFADSLQASTRLYSSSTAPGSALDFGAPLFFNNDFNALRQVIDVSGDGSKNAGADTSDSRDAALASGVDTINGITIGDASGLATWYQDNVIGGDNAFHIHATTFAEFETGIENKLIKEISVDVPEPSTLAIFALGMIGLASRRYKKQS